MITQTDPEQKKANPQTDSPKKRKYSIGTFFASLLIIIILGISSFVAYNVLYLKQHVIVSNPGGTAPILSAENPKKIDLTQVQKDGDTRINILITGMGGKNHKGGTLTDSIQMLSIDPINKTAGIVSVPRDFYDSIDKKTYNKINSVYETGEKKGNGQGGVLIKQVVGNILDLNIHYFINIDFAGFEKLIDSLGGVQITVDKAIYDPYYPDENLEGYEPFTLKAGTYTMSGELALKYARSRQTTSDFDRSRRQQKIMLAVKDKALSLGILTNPKKILNITQILSTHLKTDIQIKEIEKLAQYYKDISSQNSTTVVLDNSTNGPLVSTNQFGSYGLIPKLGLNDHTGIQNFAHSALVDPMVKTEAAKIQITYIKSRKEDAQKMIDRLSNYGYGITDGGILKILPAEYTDKLETKNRNSKPFTNRYLESRYDTLVIGKLDSSSKFDFIITLADKKSF